MTQIINLTKRRRIFVMQCGVHAYMESWGLAVENPYYTKTDGSGMFEYQRRSSRHPYADSLASPKRGRSLSKILFLIPPNENVTANFEIQARQARQSRNANNGEPALWSWHAGESGHQAHPGASDALKRTYGTSKDLARPDRTNARKLDLV